MPFYSYLKYEIKDKKRRDYVIKKIIKLKNQLHKEIPDKDTENNLLLATWNLKDFGKQNRRGFGERTLDSLYYIAEIISTFDIVAIQEINELEKWERVMRILGPSWDYIATDIADSRAGGNGERMTFVFDKRKVWFKNIAGEIVLPNKLLISDTKITDSTDKTIAGKQFRRTPYVVSFQSGWFKFDLCTVHIYYGQGKSGIKQRIQEISAIASYLSDRVDARLKEDNKATILLGDFNIIRPDHETMKALIDNGFTIPKTLQNRTSNVKGNMHYDQIAFKSDKKIIQYIDTMAANPKQKNSGVFKVMKSVFQDIESDFQFYHDAMKSSSNGKKLKGDALRKYYQAWRPYQMSDHNLMWVRIKTNSSIDYLKTLMK